MKKEVKFKSVISLILSVIMGASVCTSVPLSVSAAEASYASGARTDCKFTVQPQSKIGTPNATVSFETNFAIVKWFDIYLDGKYAGYQSVSDSSKRSFSKNLKCADGSYTIRAYWGEGDGEYVESNPFKITNGCKFTVQPKTKAGTPNATVSFETNFAIVKWFDIYLDGKYAGYQSVSDSSKRSFNKNLKCADGSYTIRAYWGEGNGEYVESNPFNISNGCKFTVQPQTKVGTPNATVSFETNFAIVKWFDIFLDGTYVGYQAVNDSSKRSFSKTLKNASGSYTIRAYWGDGDNEYIESNPFKITNGCEFTVQPQTKTGTPNATVSFETNFAIVKWFDIFLDGKYVEYQAVNDSSKRSFSKNLKCADGNYTIRAYWGDGDNEYIESNPFKITNGCEFTVQPKSKPGTPDATISFETNFSVCKWFDIYCGGKYVGYQSVSDSAKRSFSKTLKVADEPYFIRAYWGEGDGEYIDSKKFFVGNMFPSSCEAKIKGWVKYYGDTLEADISGDEADLEFIDFSKLHYQWQTSEDRETWKNVTNGNRQTIETPSSGTKVIYYRVVITSDVLDDSLTSLPRSINIVSNVQYPIEGTVKAQQSSAYETVYSPSSINPVKATFYNKIGKEVLDGIASYRWQKSVDNIRWEYIPDATEREYMPTANDELCYIRVEVTAKYTVGELYSVPKQVSYVHKDHIVSFDTQGYGNTIPDKRVIRGHEYYPPTPEDEKYLFDAWYLEPECLHKYDAKQVVTSDFTLYAKWKDKTIVKGFDIKINEPKVGEKPNFSTKMDDMECFVDTTSSNSPHYIRKGVQWIDMTDANDPVWLTEDDCFAADRVYCVLVNLNSRYGFRFSYGNEEELSTNAYVNGDSSDSLITVFEDTKALVFYRFEPLLGGEIQEADLTVEAPNAGGKPKFAARIAGEGCMVSNFSDNDNADEFTKNGVQWIDETDSVILTENDSFKPGHTYSVKINLMTEKEYSLEKNASDIKINELPADLTVAENSRSDSYVLYTFTPVPYIKYLGDADGNGIVTIDDATLIQLHLAELALISEDNIKAADINGDGIIDVNDATKLQMCLAELDDSYPIGKQL